MCWQWGQLCVMVALEAASQVSVQSWYWQRLGRRHRHHQHQTISLDLSPCGCKHLAVGQSNCVVPVSLPTLPVCLWVLMSCCLPSQCAVGHEYIADVGKHSSQTDASQGFGGKYGVQRDRADKSALGFEYKGEVEKHSSQKGKSMGTCCPLTLFPASPMLPISCAVCCGTVYFITPLLSTCFRCLFPVRHPYSPIPCCPVTAFLLYISLVPSFALTETTS